MLLPIKLPKDQKDVIIQNVQQFFEEERGEILGELGAEQLVDLMIKELGPYLYNKAIEDARKLLDMKASQLQDDLYSLEKPIRSDRR